MTEKEIVFVHAADLHLDSPLRGLPDEGEHADAIRSASRRALVRLIDETIARRAAFLIVAGDIWDGDWQDLRTGNFFIGQMRRLHERGIDVFIALGNHDMHGAWQEQLRFTVPGNVLIFRSEHPETAIREYGGLKVAVHGQSYDHENQGRNLALDYPRRQTASDINIGVLHTSLAGHAGEHESYAPCCLDDLRASGYDYWALGHVHQRKVVSAAGEPPVAYAGVLQGRQIRENGAKGAYLNSCRFAEGRPRVSLAKLDVADVVWSEIEVDIAGLEDRAGIFRAVEDRLRSIEDVAEHVRCHVIQVVLRNGGQAAGNFFFNAAELRDQFSAMAAAVDGKLFVRKVVIEHASCTSPPAAAGGLLDCLHEVVGDEQFRIVLGEDVRAVLENVPPEVRALVLDDLGMDAQARMLDGLYAAVGRNLAAVLSGGKG